MAATSYVPQVEDALVALPRQEFTVENPSKLMNPFPFPPVRPDMVLQVSLKERGRFTRRTKAQMKEQLKQYSVAPVPGALPFNFKDHPGLQNYLCEDERDILRI